MLPDHLCQKFLGGAGFDGIGADRLPWPSVCWIPPKPTSLTKYNTPIRIKSAMTAAIVRVCPAEDFIGVIGGRGVSSCAESFASPGTPAPTLLNRGVPPRKLSFFWFAMPLAYPKSNSDHVHFLLKNSWKFPKLLLVGFVIGREMGR